MTTRTTIEPNRSFNWQRRIAYFYLFIFLFALAACADPGLDCTDALGCVRIGANDPMRLAYMLALSGDAAYLGQDSLQGVEMALAERDNTFLGHPLELVGQDTACTIDRGRVAAIETADDPTIVGAIGTTCSAVADVAIPIIDRAGLVMISPTNTRPDLAQADIASDGTWHQSYFRTAPNALWQGQIAAQFAVEVWGSKTAAVVYDDTEGSEALAQAFADAFMGLSGRVIFTRQISVGQTDVSDVVNLVSSGQPNLLYLPLFEPEANLIINNLPEESNVFLLGSDNLLLSSFAESTGVAVRGMAITGAAVTGAGYDAFLDEWLVRYGSEPTLPYQAYAYDATNILLNAIEAVAVVGRNDALLIGRQALRQAISQIQLEGLTGELACTTTECSRPAAIGVYELTDEQISGTAWPPPLLWSATNSTQP